MRTGILLLVLLSWFILTGCPGREETAKSEAPVTAGEVKQEAREAAGKAVAFTRQQLDTYLKGADQKIADFDRKLAELKARAEKLNEAARKELDRQVAEMQEKREEAARRLQELRNASGEAWGDLKKGSEAALDEMDQAVDRALSRYP